MTAARSFYTSDVYAEHYLGIRWPRAVWAAVIEQAVCDALAVYPAANVAGLDPQRVAAVRAEPEELRAGLWAAAEHWVADDANEPRRFVWVCEQLGLDPGAVRRSIKARQRG